MSPTSWCTLLPAGTSWDAFGEDLMDITTRVPASQRLFESLTLPPALAVMSLL